jgi:hypothetical protein
MRLKIFCFFIVLASNLLSQLYIDDLPLKIYISILKQNYRLDEDIKLQIEVRNEGSKPVFIYPAGYKLLNFEIKILNLKNAEILEKLNPDITELKNQNPYLFIPKELELYPDEIYKVELNLNEYYKIEESGRYKITVSFKPYIDNENIKFNSNPIYLNILPTERQRMEQEIVLALKKEEEAKSYTPYSLIKFLLDSKIKGDWNNYFLYQNLDSIILKYPKFSEKYLKASDEMKKDIIEEFKKYEIERPDNKIEEYSIEEIKESFKELKATVRCKIKYKKPAVFQNYVYEFYLVKKGNKWFVQDFEVINYEK